MAGSARAAGAPIDVRATARWLRLHDEEVDGLSQAQEGERSALRRLVVVVRRRRWLVLAVVVLVPVVALLGSLLQEKRFQATAQVLLTRGDLAADVSNAQRSPDLRDPERVAETRAQLARTEELARRVIRGARRSDLTPGAFLADSSVSPRADADILLFRVSDRYRDVAIRLATEYGRQFTRYISELDTAPLARAERAVQQRLRQLEADGEEDSRVYATLTQNLDQLRVERALRTAGATLVRPANGASLTRPRLVRNGALGLVVGLALALGLAFLREALDTRVRTGEEVSERLGMPLLARLPAPPRRLRPRQDVAMLNEPTSPAAEPFRVLRTNLEFVSLEQRAALVMITSAAPMEGKSTTAANLAVALARSGRRVVLVDLDLRRPTLHRFFDAAGHVGLSDVALGHVGLDEALITVPLELPEAELRLNGGADMSRISLSNGRLELLTTGPLPPDAGGFIGSVAMAEVLSELRRRGDIVLFDTPPVLPVGDAMALSARIDGVVIMSRLSVVTRSMLSELRRQLDASPAAKLGVVISQAEVEDEPGYAGSPYSYGYYGYEDADRETPVLVPDVEPHPASQQAEPTAARRRQVSPYPTADDVRGMREAQSAAASQPDGAGLDARVGAAFRGLWDRARQLGRGGG